MSKCLVVVVGVSVVCAFASTTWSEPPAQFDPKSADILAINQRLMSGDSNQVDQAIASIRQYFEQQPTQAGQLLGKWASPLMLAHRYEEASALGLAGALAEAAGNPANAGAVEAALTLRVRALMKLGRCDEALESAKSLYNVALMRSTSRVVDLVADVLACARKTDPDIGKRFRSEQLAAASTNTVSEAAAKDPAILASVKVDDKPYKSLIAKMLEPGNLTPQTLIAVGNVYLIADHPKEAEEMFQQAYGRVTDALWRTVAAEGIARSIRAEDGNVRRANQWVIAERAKKQ